MPSSVVGRFEVLKDGASSIYGADAIAGVVNVITRERIEGFQLNFQGAAPRGGAPEDVGVDATWGTVGDTWSFNISANYSKTREMTANDRDWSRCPVRPRGTDQDGDGVIDNTHPETGELLCFGFVHGFAVSPFGWARYEPSLGAPHPNHPHFDPGIAGFGIPHFTRIPVHGNDPRDGDPIFDNEGAFYRDERDPGGLPGRARHRAVLGDFLRRPGPGDRRPQRQRVLRVLLQPPVVRELIRLQAVLSVRTEDQPHEPVRPLRTPRRVRRLQRPAGPPDLRAARSLQQRRRRPGQPVRRGHR